MTTFTAYNNDNDREIRMMFNKAVCAYACWMDLDGRKEELREFNTECEIVEEIVMRKSEYEATARCIAMFVKDSLPEICMAIIEEAEEMMA